MIQSPTLATFSRKMILPALSLALILIAPNHSLANKQETARLMFEATKLILKGENEKALRYLKTFHLVTANLGDLYLRQKRYDEAMKFLKQSLVDMPTLARSHKLIGQIHQAQGN